MKPSFPNHLLRRRIKRRKEKGHRVPRTRRSRNRKGGRDESEEEEENSELVARVRVYNALPQAKEAVERAVTEVSEPERGEAALPQAREVEKETGADIPRAEESAPKYVLGMIDLSRSPLFSDSMINEDVIGFGDIPVPTKAPSLGDSGSSSSSRLVDQFPTSSVDPDRKRSIIISIPEDAPVLSAPVRVASYLWCLVIEEDQAKMDEVEAPYLFNESQQALNWASAELEATRKEHAEWVEQVNRVLEDSEEDLDTVANDPILLVQKRLDRIRQLQAKVDTKKAEAEEWKRNMDLLASEKEAVQAQLALTEAQLQATEEKALTRAKTIEEIWSQLSSQTRKEALKGVHAQGFDLLDEIENAKISETKARKPAYPEEEDFEGSEDSDEPEGGEDPEGDDAAPGED
uniref:Uncharacterized protein n=1 Tax=Nicotiana tabacum TaxID=4097 RepID=A0A1S4BHH6_TOBAC|nr:PREDICTED: uncharacterized protein LOC107808335 [Nicotiana tabacum]